MENSEKFTALVLLNAVADFKIMTPESDEWSFEKQKDNPPRLVRLQMIDSLYKAFMPKRSITDDISKNLYIFDHGSFIFDRKIEEYTGLISLIENTILQSKFGAHKKGRIDLDALQTNFVDLMHFKQHITSLVNYNRGLMEISYPYYFTYLVTNSISDSVLKYQAEIDNYLALFIDPEKKSFTKEELIKSFNFPTADLDEIDFDWM